MRGMEMAYFILFYGPEAPFFNMDFALYVPCRVLLECYYELSLNSQS